MNEGSTNYVTPDEALQQVEMAQATEVVVRIYLEHLLTGHARADFVKLLYGIKRVTQVTHEFGRADTGEKSCIIIFSVKKYPPDIQVLVD